MLPNPNSYQQSYPYNLLNWIVKSVPEHVCQIPTVTYINGKSETVQIPPEILIPVMSAISKAWELARQLGISNLSYSYQLNKFIISPGRSSRQSRFSRDGQKMAIIEETLITDSQIFYGIESPWYNIGYSVISDYLVEVICFYQQTLKHSVQKIAKSYGEMVILGGTNTDDVPLLREVQGQTKEEWSENKSVLAPEKSSLSSISGSISDLERIMRPTSEAIATEAGVPVWLLFPSIVDSQFELENRASWSIKCFNRYVVPVLQIMLGQMGYAGVTILPPTYRCSSYQADVDNTLAEVGYKNSSKDRNNAQVKQVNQQVRLEKLAALRELDKPGTVKKPEAVKSPKVRQGRVR